MTLPLALTVADGALILVGLLVLMFVAVAFGLYTRRGSGISRTPYADLDHDSGPESSADWDDATEEIRNLGRGTAGHHGHRHPPPPQE